jgi:hypothetical protein
MSRTFMSNRIGIAVYLKDMTFNANTQPGDPGARRRR